MRFLLLLGTFVLMLGVAVQVSGCQKLALSGPKKYKISAQSTLSEIRNEINSSATVSNTSTVKLDKLLSTWEEEMSDMGSFKQLKQLRTMIDEAAQEENPFNVNRNIIALSDSIEIALKSEVVD